KADDLQGSRSAAWAKKRSGLLRCKVASRCHRTLGTKWLLLLAQGLAVRSQQQRRLHERRCCVGKVGREVVLHRAVGPAIVLLLAAIADTHQNAETVRLQRKARCDAAQKQYLFGPRFADVGEQFQCSPRFGVRPREDRVEVAAELVEGDARD